MAKKSNQPLLDELTDQQRNAVLDGADAVKELAEFSRRSFELWMRVARGVAAICIVADRPGTSRKARKNLLADNGYGTLNEGTVSRLKRMAEFETAIRLWRDSLTPNKRDRWKAPTSICNRCPAMRKAIEADKAKKPRKPRTVNRPLLVEHALDTLLDHLQGLDTDNRLAVIERILSPFDLRLTPLATKAKTEIKSKPAKKAEKVNSALEWIDGGNDAIGNFEPRHRYSATVPAGSYYVSPAFALTLKGPMPFVGYDVSFRPVQRNSDRRYIKTGIKTAEQAKAIAQRDYDSQAS